jgi:protein phosphatase methylesterase 1
MSDLQKSFLKARVAHLPPEAPAYEEADYAEADGAGGRLGELHEDDASSASSASSTGTVMPSPSRKLFARPSGYVQIPQE